MNIHEIESSLGHQGWDYWLYEEAYSGRIHGLDEAWDVRVVRTVGGGEGDGEHVEIVFEMMDMDGVTRYFRKTGGYASFAGTYWDGPFEEVFPQQKTITVYEKA